MEYQDNGGVSKNTLAMLLYSMFTLLKSKKKRIVELEQYQDKIAELVKAYNIDIPTKIWDQGMPAVINYILNETDDELKKLDEEINQLTGKLQTEVANKAAIQQRLDKIKKKRDQLRVERNDLLKIKAHHEHRMDKLEERLGKVGAQLRELFSEEQCKKMFADNPQVGDNVFKIMKWIDKQGLLKEHEREYAILDEITACIKHYGKDLVDSFNCEEAFKLPAPPLDKNNRQGIKDWLDTAGNRQKKYYNKINECYVRLDPFTGEARGVNLQGIGNFFNNMSQFFSLNPGLMQSGGAFEPGEYKIPDAAAGDMQKILQFFHSFLRVGEVGGKEFYIAGTDDDTIDAFINANTDNQKRIYDDLVNEDLINCAADNYGLELLKINVGGTAFAYPIFAKYKDDITNKKGIYALKLFLISKDRAVQSKQKAYQLAYTELQVFEAFNNLNYDGLPHIVKGRPILEGVDHKKCESPGGVGNYLKFNNMKIKYNLAPSGTLDFSDIDYSGFINSHCEFGKQMLIYEKTMDYYEKKHYEIISKMNTTMVSYGSSSYPKIFLNDAEYFHTFIQADVNRLPPVNIDTLTFTLKYKSGGDVKEVGILNYKDLSSLFKGIIKRQIKEIGKERVEEEWIYADITKELTLNVNTDEKLSKLFNYVKDNISKILRTLAVCKDDCGNIDKWESAEMNVGKFTLTYAFWKKPHVWVGGRLPNFDYMQSMSGNIGNGLTDEIEIIMIHNHPNLDRDLHKPDSYNIIGDVAFKTNFQTLPPAIYPNRQPNLRAMRTTISDRINKVNMNDTFYIRNQDNYAFSFIYYNYGTMTGLTDIISPKQISFGLLKDVASDIEQDKLIVNEEKKMRFCNESKLQSKQFDVEFLLLEYLSGGSICRMLKKKEGGAYLLDNDGFIHSIIQILFQTEYLFRKIAFFHGDLHANNVLFGFDPNYDPATNKFYEYKYKNMIDGTIKSIYIPVKKYFPKLIDFDKSFIVSQKVKETNDICQQILDQKFFSVDRSETGVVTAAKEIDDLKKQIKAKGSEIIRIRLGGTEAEKRTLKKLNLERENLEKRLKALEMRGGSKIKQIGGKYQYVLKGAFGFSEAIFNRLTAGYNFAEKQADYPNGGIPTINMVQTAMRTANSMDDLLKQARAKQGLDLLVPMKIDDINRNIVDSAGAVLINDTVPYIVPSTRHEMINKKWGDLKFVWDKSKMVEGSRFWEYLYTQNPNPDDLPELKSLSEILTTEIQTMTGAKTLIQIMKDTLVGRLKTVGDIAREIIKSDVLSGQIVTDMEEALEELQKKMNDIDVPQELLQITDFLNKDIDPIEDIRVGQEVNLYWIINEKIPLNMKESYNKFMRTGFYNFIKGYFNFNNELEYYSPLLTNKIGNGTFSSGDFLYILVCIYKSFKEPDANTPSYITNLMVDKLSGKSKITHEQYCKIDPASTVKADRDDVRQFIDDLFRVMEPIVNHFNSYPDGTTSGDIFNNPKEKAKDYIKKLDLIGGKTGISVAKDETAEKLRIKADKNNILRVNKAVTDKKTEELGFNAADEADIDTERIRLEGLVDMSVVDNQIKVVDDLWNYKFAKAITREKTRIDGIYGVGTTRAFDELDVFKRQLRNQLRDIEDVAEADEWKTILNENEAGMDKSTLKYGNLQWVLTLMEPYLEKTGLQLAVPPAGDITNDFIDVSGFE